MLKIDLVNNTGFIKEDFLEKKSKIISEVEKKYNDGKLGFIDLDEKNEVEKIKKFVSKTKKDFEFVVVLGIGGSALGTKAILEAIKGKFYNDLSRAKRGDNPKIYILDNIDPSEIKNLLDIIKLKKTLFIVISKSGSTIETLAQYNFFKEKVEKKDLKIEKHFVFIAGENSDFANEKIKKGFKVFTLPENVGGRFSVFSNVGLLPLGFSGIDIEKLLLGQKSYKKIFFEDNLITNLALNSALLQFDAYRNGGKNITVFFPYISNFRSLGLWYKQIFNESLGKSGLGPTLTTAIGTTDQHSDLQLFIEGPNDKFIVFIESDKFQKDFKIFKDKKIKFSNLMQIQKYGTEKSLSEKGISNYTIKLDKIDEETIGQLIFFFEMQIAFLGEFLEINAFDQPGVEIGKKIAKQRIEKVYGEYIF